MNTLANHKDHSIQPSDPPKKTVVIAGGYGVFGRWICEELASDSARGGLQLVIAGRSRTKAEALAEELTDEYPSACIRGHTLDVNEPSALQLLLKSSFVLINCCGPFQARDYRVAKACIANGTHYIDMADSRDFVVGITELNKAAKAAGVCVISGASSVPGLSSAVLKELCADMAAESIELAIAPGNKAPRGEATVHSILLSAGQPINYWQNSRWQQRLGWFNHRRMNFGRAGRRWLANVDIPDLSLLPAQYPTAKSVTFQAGLELKLLHFGLFFIAAISRLLRRPLGFAAAPLTRIARWFEGWGSDVGAMRVAVTGQVKGQVEGHVEGYGEGIENNQQPVSREWLLTAGSGHGPRIPTIASIVLCRKLLSAGANTQPFATLPPSGAMPCMELFTEAEFREAVAHLDIECQFSNRQAPLS